MMRLLFIILSRLLFKFLNTFADSIPKRFARCLAIYYPDVRIRKLFWQKTCVLIGERSDANIGMIVVDDYDSGEVLLEIGKGVSLAPRIVFVPVSLPNNSYILQQNQYVKEKLIKRQKIIVEDDVWIGANVTILPGVRIGRGAIVGAGAVVTQDVAPYTIVAGVPAREIRNIESYNPNFK